MARPAKFNAERGRAVVRAIDGGAGRAEAARAAGVGLRALGDWLARARAGDAAMAELTKPYDVCLIDTGPSRSLLTTNVLNYAAEVAVPIAPGVFGFVGLGQLQADMDLVRRFLENKALTLAGVVLVMVERNNVSRVFERQSREALGGLVYKTTVPRSVAFEEANARHLAITDHAPKSAGAAAYWALTLEVLSRGSQANRDESALGDPPGDHAA